MDQILGYALGVLIVLPMLTLLHEFGHALPQLLIKKKVIIDIGGSSCFPTIKLGRLFIRIAPFSTFNGFCSISSSLSKRELLVTLLGGPIVSFVLAAVLFVQSQSHLSSLVHLIMNFALYGALFQFLITFLPIKYPRFLGRYGGHKSDGLKVLEVINKRNAKVARG